MTATPTVSTLEQALDGLGAALDRLEAQVLGFFEALVSRRLAEHADDPAILRAPLVRAARIRLEDVNLDLSPAAAQAADASDPQAAFLALAEQAGSYRLAAQQSPEAWAAARDAADLDGPDDHDDGPNKEVARLVEQAVVEYGLTASEATYLVMDQRPDLWHRTRGVRT